MYRQNFHRPALRRIGPVRGVILLAALIVAGAVLLQRRPAIETGPVRVVDGDSLRLNGRDIRLKGIDAPELHQGCERRGRPYACGEAARDALLRLVGTGDVRCAIEGRDRYGRSLATCSAGSIDLGAALVSSGWAVAFGAYEAEEREARARRAGIWEGSFERPRDWRQEHPRP